MWVVLAGPQRIRQYVKYALSAGMFVLFGIMSFTDCFGGVEDVFSGTVTKDMALSHVMYEKTWARGAGMYSRFLPSQSAGRFDLMMDGGDEYIHFHIARRDREVLASMMEGLTVRGKTIRIEDLIPAVEEGRKSFAMYDGGQISGGKDVMYRITYYPHTKILVSAERIP